MHLVPAGNLNGNAMDFKYHVPKNFFLIYKILEMSILNDLEFLGFRFSSTFFKHDV